MRPRGLRWLAQQPQFSRYLCAGRKAEVDTYDVAICGGGLVGSSLALSLARERLAAPLRVALVEQHAPENAPPQDVGLRTSTVTPRSRQWLERLGAWPEEYAAAFDQMVVYDRRQAVEFRARDAGLTQLGHVVGNDQLRYSIYAQLREAAPVGSEGAQVTEVPATVTDLETSVQSPSAVLKLSNGRTLHARVVVGAEGAGSKSRQAGGITSWTYDYRQSAVVANLRVREPTSTAWQRFLSTGPVALLPVRGQSTCNLIWSTTKAEADGLLALDDARFLDEVNLAFDENWSSRVPPEAVEVLGCRKSFPLRAAHATEYSRGRLVLVGDAAHTIHPMAGQGVNLGFADAEELTGTLAHGAATGRDIGRDAALLLKYQQNRMPENLAMTGALHILNEVYSWQSPPLEALRAAGVRAIDSLAPAKRLIMRFAGNGLF